MNMENVVGEISVKRALDINWAAKHFLSQLVLESLVSYSESIRTILLLVLLQMFQACTVIV